MTREASYWVSPFKEDVSDTRNSKVVSLVKELAEYRMKLDVWDHHANADAVQEEYGITLSEPTGVYDVIVAAVAHRDFSAMSADDIGKLSHDETLVFDLKSMFAWGKQLEHRYWKL